MNKLSVILISFLFFGQIAMAQMAVGLADENFTSIYFKGYSEFKSQSDSNIPIVLSDNNTKIIIHQKQGAIVRLQAQRTFADSIETSNFIVENETNQLLLVGLNKRSHETFFNELDALLEVAESAPKCELKVDQIQKTAKNVKAITESTSRCAAYASALDASLSENFGLKDPFKGLLNCVSSKLFQQSDTFKDKSLSAQIQAFLVSQASILKSKDKQGLVGMKCIEGDEGKKLKAPAKSTESGEIILNFESPSLVNSLKGIKEETQQKVAVKNFASTQTAHELLHLAGIPQKDEKLVHKIIATCEDMNYFSKQSVIGLALPVVGNAAGVDRARAVTGQNKEVGGKKEPVWVTKPIDPESKLAKGANNPTSAPTGSAGGVGRASSLAASAKAVDVQQAPEINQLIKADPNPARTVSLIKANELETVVAESQERTAPLRNYVNTVMDDAIPKAEASGRIAKDSSLRSSSTRESSKGSSLGKQITGRDGEKYTVVEEYLADGTPKKNSSASRSIASASSVESASGNFKPSVSQNAVSAEVVTGSVPNRIGSERGPQGDTKEKSLSASTASTANAARSNPVPTGNTTSSLSNGSRNPASVSAKQAANGTISGSTNEMTAVTVDYIKATPYNELRSQYRNPDFKQRLIDADITIMNSEGKYIGASKGQIRYLDKGDRIIRMK